MVTSGSMRPHEIEQKSFAIIGEELGGRTFPDGQEPVVKRVIHTTADFAYADSLYFSPGIIAKAQAALRNGATIITDTQMVRAGINKKTAATFGCEVICLMDDETVAKTALQNGTTRAVAAMNMAAQKWPQGLYFIGNAPTALLRLCELYAAGQFQPALVVGVPVGFVNVVESKKLLIESGMPCIVAEGRKGGSNVAAAICNALMYTMGTA